ncbi:MAG: methyl-accepting chemotaxis protein [Methanomassiliicoccales archaeon]
MEGQAEESHYFAVEEMISTLPLAAFAINANMKITHFNERAEKLTGITEDEAIGMRIKDVFGGSIGGKGCPLAESIKNGKSIELEQVNLKLEDEERLCSISAKPILDREGKVIGGIGFIKEISLHKDMCSAYLDAVATPIVAINLDYKIMYANKATLNLLKKEEKDVLGKDCYKLFNTQFCRTEHCPVKMAIQGKSVHGDAVARTEEGREIPIRVSASPVFDKNGKVVGAVEHIVDISNEVEITKDVELLTEAAKRGEFSSRADESKYEGNYRAIVHALNQTLDVVVDRTYWYEQILDSIPFPLSVTDADMKITFINKASENVLKTSRKNVLGKHCSCWQGPICNTDQCGIIRLRSGQTTTYTGRDGKHTKIDVAYLTNAKGEKIGHVEVLQDVTAARSLNLYTKSEVERIAANLKRLSAGDLNLDLAVGEGDSYTKEARENFIKMNANLSQVVEAISSLIIDAEMLADAAKAEKFNVRADVTRHKGDYAKVVAGFNATLDTIVDKIFWYEQLLDAVPMPLSVTDKEMNWTFINKAVEDLLKIKRKDILGKKCSNWNANICGTKNCGIAKLRNGETRTFFEQAGMNFQVDVAFIKNAKGENVGHIEVVQDITATQKNANYMKQEVERVASNLKKLSQGQLELDTMVGEGDQYTVEAKENFSKINASLAQVVEAISNLTADARMLTEAATEGRLSTRADASRHQGEYRIIVEGVNSTLDAVIGPIEEAMRVAEAYSKGDMTARIDIDLKGDFKRFADALNHTGESLTQLLKEVNNSVAMVSSTSQELASSAEEMNASTEQVSSAIQQISKGAQNQAAQVEDTAKMMAEMASSSEKVGSTVKAAIDAAKASSQSAKMGRSTVDLTIKKMREIQAVVEESAKVIASLGKRSEEIGQIVDVITNISDQTNLLALNAAIEAARAGEQGRGFAVVAEEVKNLAEDSREAAERIAKMIKEVQAETAKAVESMQRGTKETAEGIEIADRTGKAFQEIDSLATSVDESLDRLGPLIDQQKDQMLRSAKAVDGIASIAEETASAAEESASSTEELTASMEDMTARAQALSEMAMALQKVSSQFKINDELESKAKQQKPSQSKVVEGSKKETGKGQVAMPKKVREALIKRGIEA